VERDRVWRWLAGACAVFGLLGLLWTLSRGAWLGGIAVLVVWPVMIVLAGRDRALVKRLGLGLGAAVVVAAVGAAVTPGFAARASQIVDIQSRTARWRVSAWRSAWQMTLDRPFLGFGPNNFRFAYPLYQEPGQIGGKTGYRVVEAAHNFLLDTSTSLGIPGLVLLVALLGLTAYSVVRGLSDEPNGLGVATVSLAALVGGFVAVQFHYVTMDTGPLLATLVAFIAVGEARRRPDPETPVPVYVRPALAGAALVYAVALVAGLGLMAADAAASRGAAAARAKVPWSVARAELRRAAALAPWEPQLRRAEGTAATVRVLKDSDAAVLADGLSAFEDVLRMTPGDAIVAAERANLMLAVGVKTNDKRLLLRAVDAFSGVIEQDPNTGIPRAGRASALLALGRTNEAIEDYRAALKRSPGDRTAWGNLASAYQRAGRAAEAKRARAKARAGK
jgi:hypothetical protein